jgi:probable rRNA maturation factor
MIFVKRDVSLEKTVAGKLLKHAALEALRGPAAPGFELPGSETPVDLTILQTDDDHVRALNHEYLGQDASTDVLSFPALETDPETGALYLGDIVISIPRAADQAREAGHSLESETQLLVVHGVLHLLGHDHAEAEEKHRMWAAQAGALNRLGLGGISIRED